MVSATPLLLYPEETDPVHIVQETCWALGTGVDGSGKPCPTRVEAPHPFQLVADCCNKYAVLACILNQFSPYRIWLSNFCFHTFTFISWSVIGRFPPSSLTSFLSFLISPPPSKLFQVVKLLTCIYEGLSFYLS